MTDNNSFCPECGQKVSSADEFCPNCGFKLIEGIPNQKKNSTKKQTQNSNLNNARSKQTPKRNQIHKKMNKKTKAMWICGFVLVVVLIAGFLFGKGYYSKENTVNRIVSAMQDNKDAEVARLAYTNDPSFKVTSDSMKPTIAYYSENKDQLSKLKNQFMHDNADQQTDRLEFKQDGHAWLIFPKYKILVKPVYASIYTNVDGVSLKVNGKEVTKDMGDAQFKKVGPIAPGHYEVATSGKVNGKDLTNNGQFDWINGANQSATLPLQTITFTVKGQSGADVLINKKKVGTIGDDGTLKFDNYQFSTNMNVQISMKGASGAPIISKPYELSSTDDNSTIEPEFDGIATQDEADSMLNDLWDNTVNGSSSDSDYEAYFSGGKNNADFRDLANALKGYNADDDIDSYSCTEKTESVVPYDPGETQVTYQVKWSFDNDNGDTHEQVFEYTAIIAKDDDSPDGYVIKSNHIVKKISDKTTSVDSDDDE